MRAVSVLSPAPRSSPSLHPPPLPPSVSPLPYRGASWAIMWSHYLTPRCSRVQLTKTASGPSCGKDSLGTQHTFQPPPPPPHYHQQILTFSHPSEALRCSLLPLTCEGRRRRLSPGRKRIFFCQSARTLPRLDPTTSERFGQLLFVSLSCTPHVM